MRSYLAHVPILVLLALWSVLDTAPAAGSWPSWPSQSSQSLERPLDELGPAAAPLVADGPRAELEAPASIDQLRARVAEILAREGVPGVGLALVTREGVVWSDGVGVADLDTGAPVTAETQFRVASITKSVVALGVMRLVEQGQLELDEPLAQLMPDIEIHNDWPEAPITLAHVLEHTAGFDDMRFNEWFGDEDMSPREALALNPRSRVARWRPGSRMSYSNPGYTVAGHAIELGSGEPWDRYLEREVLRPLGMDSARFRRTPEFADRLATGHRGPQQPVAFRPIAHHPAGSLLASPRELASLVHFWLRRDPGLVSPAALARIERTETLAYLGTDTNYGLGNYGDLLDPARSRGHDGGLPGFLSTYRYFPELGVGYVMLLNATHSMRAYVEIRALLFAYLTRGRVLPTPPSAPPDPEAIAAASGFYGFENPRMELFGFIDRVMIGLHLRPGPDGIELELPQGARVGLIPTGDGGFRHPSQAGTSLRSTTNAEGERILLVGMGYFEASSATWARVRRLGLGLALVLVQIAPLWALGWVLVAGFRRLRGRSAAPGELGLYAWPALAGLCFAALVPLLTTIVEREAFATANPLTIGLCLSTLAFAACSALAASRALRELASPARVRPALVPIAASFACFALTIYLMVHGIIGLRLWAW
ncbi:putative penicillin-binding protein PbpX [Enhygromyxa salina]|uniref:Putative penicillin-binding protein PbpX n=1 Tax=Enhygromyxa salina TaxID=215803 RepID=A0A2S9XF94_9BACT|nr:serine hydrolase domain-containing protein [Enhygromyxa salina]PRP91535.1 putative penicillin-binding protein PbpX [Enhygromyxa salina]